MVLASHPYKKEIMDYTAEATIVKNSVSYGYDTDYNNLTVVIMIDGQDVSMMGLRLEEGATEAAYSAGLEEGSKIDPSLGIKDFTPIANAVEDAVQSFYATGTLPAYSGKWTV
jgi:hypothetical protein